MKREAARLGGDQAGRVEECGEDEGGASYMAAALVGLAVAGARGSRSEPPHDWSRTHTANPWYVVEPTERMVAEPEPLPTRKTTRLLGRRIARTLEPSDLVLLSGPLGVGKTFLARQVIRALGVSSKERVASPTFALVHEYEARGRRVLHADLYRLRDSVRGLPSELENLGLKEARTLGAIVLVEWGEGTQASLGDPTIVIRLACDDGARVAWISGHKVV